VEISVNVKNVDLSSVIDGKARVYNPDSDEYDCAARTSGEAVSQHIAEDLKRDESYGALRKKVLDIRNEETHAQVAPIVAAAIEEPIRRTNTYGEATSGTTTLRELIARRWSRT
jgi:hypothetical protein